MVDMQIVGWQGFRRTDQDKKRRRRTKRIY